MASYSIKQIDYLRQKAGLTYEQAIELLDRCGGDLAQALIELERAGAFREERPSSGKSARAEEPPRENSRGRSFVDTVIETFIKGLRLKLKVEKNDEVLLNLPIIYLAICALFAHTIALVSIILVFVTGCRVHLVRSSNPEGDQRIRGIAHGAEHTVRQKVAEVTQIEDDDDHYGSYTVDK